VERRTKDLPIAAALTVSGALVAWRFGGLFWGLVLGRLWCRLLLLLLAAQWLTTLANVWNRVYQGQHNVCQAPSVEPLFERATAKMGLQEGRDV